MTLRSIDIGNHTWRIVHLTPDILELYPRAGGRAVIHALFRALKSSGLKLIEIVPAFDCIAVQFAEPPSEEEVNQLSNLNLDAKHEPKIWKLDVCFDLGLDMTRMERKTGLDRLQIQHILQRKPLTVAACGFLPGFVYFDGLDPRLVCDRRRDPRQKVAAGYFAIGGKQAGVYGVDSPGGWNLIGKSPHSHFNPLEDPPMPFEPGDLVHIEAISQADYDRLKNA